MRVNLSILHFYSSGQKISVNAEWEEEWRFENSLYGRTTSLGSANSALIDNWVMLDFSYT